VSSHRTSKLTYVDSIVRFLRCLNSIACRISSYSHTSLWNVLPVSNYNLKPIDNSRKSFSTMNALENQRPNSLLLVFIIKTPQAVSHALTITMSNWFIYYLIHISMVPNNWVLRSVLLPHIVGLVYLQEQHTIHFCVSFEFEEEYMFQLPLW